MAQPKKYNVYMTVEGEETIVLEGRPCDSKSDAIMRATMWLGMNAREIPDGAAFRAEIAESAE